MVQRASILRYVYRIELSLKQSLIYRLILICSIRFYSRMGEEPQNNIFLIRWLLKHLAFEFIE